MHRAQKFDRLRPIDCAGSRQQHADHRREDRRGEHPVQHASAELRLRRERLVDVQRIHIAGDLDEAPHVVFSEGLREGDVLSDFEVVDARDLHSFARIDFQRVHDSSRAFLLPAYASLTFWSASAAGGGASPARMKP